MNKYLTSSTRVKLYAHFYPTNLISKDLLFYSNSLEIIEKRKQKDIQYLNNLYHLIAVSLIHLRDTNDALPFMESIQKKIKLENLN